MKDLLINNINIIKKDQIIKNGAIIVDNGIIQYIGESFKTIEKTEFKKIIDGKNKIATPGLVNAHTHSPMGLLRNYADDLTFSDWLFGKIIPAEDQLTGEDIYWGAMLASAEMIQSGTTAFMDMYMHMDEIGKAVDEVGLKACLSKDILKSAARYGGIGVETEEFKQFYNYFNNKSGRIKVNMEIHSVYLYDEQSLRKAAEVAKEMKIGVHIHLLESPFERGNSVEMYGMDPIEACLKFGIFDVPVSAAHCVHLTEENRDILKQKNVSVLHNPTSNLKLGNGIADAPAMLEKGINVAIGTDGAASNNNLNLFEEMHLAALLHKGIKRDPAVIKAQEVVEMATVNGAKAIGFNDTGILEEGKKADIILIDTDKPHLQPLNNLYATLVYSAQASDVDTVIVDGKVLMENRELKTIDWERVSYEAKRSAARILSQINK